MSRILLLDDDRHVLAALARRLPHEAHEVVTAMSGAEALAVVPTVDLAIVDIQLGADDGVVATVGVEAGSITIAPWPGASIART